MASEEEGVPRMELYCAKRDAALSSRSVSSARDVLRFMRLRKVNDPETCLALSEGIVRNESVAVDECKCSAVLPPQVLKSTCRHPFHSPFPSVECM
jgi:hypothetical protein